MRGELMDRVGSYLKKHKKKRRAYAALALACVVIAVSVYGALSLPAISMTKAQPQIEAKQRVAALGEAMEARVSAEAPEGKEPFVFVLHTLSNGGGLSEQYEFDEQETCEIETEDGSALVLNRDRRPEGETNYWFALEPGQTTAFTLICESGCWAAPDNIEEDAVPLGKKPEESTESSSEESSSVAQEDGSSSQEELQPEQIEADDASQEESHQGLFANLFQPAYALDEETAADVLVGEFETDDQQTDENRTDEPASTQEQETLSEEELGEEAPSSNEAEPFDTEENDAPEEQDTPPETESLPSASSEAPPDDTGTEDDDEDRLPNVSLDDQDLEQVNFLARDGEDQFLQFQCAMADDYEKALDTAGKNDVCLELNWKETLEERTLTAVTDSGVTVTMTGTEDAFPAGDLVLKVKELPLQEEEPNAPAPKALDALDRAMEADEMLPLERRLFDIKLLLDDEEVEPLKQITVTFSDLMETESGSTRAKVYHVDEDAESATNMETWMREDGSVVMNTDHFSIYSVVLAEAGSNSITVEHLLDRFGITSQFAVFANEMEAEGHMEGVIAVKKLTLNGGFVISTARNGGQADSGKLTLVVTKKIEGTAPDRTTYHFGVYEADASKNAKPVQTFDIVGAGSESVSLSPGNYRVFELDESGNQIQNGQGDGFTVSYDALNLNGGLNGGTGYDNKTSYVDNFTIGTSSQMNIDGNGILYVGEENTVKDRVVTTPEGAKITVQNVETIHKPTNVDWDANFKRLEALSRELASCTADYNRTDLTTPGVRFLNVKVPANGVITKQLIANSIGESDQNLNSGIPLGEEQYLVVNLDCSAVKEGNVVLPEVGPNSNNAGGWKPEYCRMIWNVVNNGDCYNGTVSMQNAAAGVILIPKGTVDQSATFGGSILANKAVRSTQEIHQHSIRVNSQARTVITNTYAGITKGLSLKKTDVDGNALRGVTFELYAADENWEKANATPVQSQTSDSSGKVAFNNLQPGNYLLFESKAADGFVLPSEPWKVQVAESGVTLNGEASPENGAFPIVNQKGGQTTNVSVTKEWVGDNGTHPASVRVWLVKNGARVEPPVTLNSNNAWKYTWNNLPLDENGEQIAYAVEEEPVAGYETTVSRTEGTEYMQGWQKVPSFTDGGTYRLVYNSNGEALSGLSRNPNLTTDTVNNQLGARAEWRATASGNGFKLTNVNTGRYLELYKSYYGYYYIGTASQSSSSTVSHVFSSDSYGRLYALTRNSKYYISGVPSNSSINTSIYQSDGCDFTFYEWQDKEVLNVDYIITNTKEAIIPDKMGLEHHKTIDALRDGQNNPDTTLDDNTADLTDFYRLYLNVKAGMIGSPADVVLVLDNSNSMQEDDMGGDTRAEVVVDNAKWLAGKVLESDPRNNVSVVGYSGSWKNAAGENGLKSNGQLYSSGAKDAWSKTGWSNRYKTLESEDLNPLLDDILKKEGTSNYKGSGTNIMQALRKAETLLDESEDKRPDVHRYVIFISDGYPTYYYLRPTTTGILKDFNGIPYYYWPSGTSGFYFNPDNYNASNAFDSGYYQGRFGTGGSSSGDYAKQPTIDYAKALRERHDDAVFYTLGVGSVADTTSPLMEGTLKQIATSSEHYFVANDTGAIEDAFHSIMYGKKVSHVSITDHLSQYVNWYGEQPDVLVTMRKADGTLVKLWQGTGPGTQGTIGKALPGNRVTQEDKKQVSVVQDVNYTPTPGTADTTTGTVQVVFNPDYELENDCTYTLSFNVKTTQTAYDEYADNLKDGLDGYDDVKGDVYTDYGNSRYDNDTSSKKPGFHSNQSAEVKYVADGESYKEPYDHPVIQVAGCGLMIRKTDLMDQGKLLPGAEFDLYRAANQGSTNAGLIPGADNVYGIKVNEAPLITDQDGVITVRSLAPGEFYLVETKAPTGYQLLSKPVHFFLKPDGVDVQGNGAAQAMAQAILPVEDGTPGIRVMNTDGYNLPRTGGAGTALYTALGLLLITAAGAIYLIKRLGERRNI